MAYAPSIDDIQDLIPQQQSAGGYSPSLSDVQDLIPAQSAQASGASVPRGNANSSAMSPMESAGVGLYTGALDLAHGLVQPIVEEGGPLANLPYFGSGDKTGIFGNKVAQISKDIAAKRAASYQTAKDANPLSAGAGNLIGNVAATMLFPEAKAASTAMKFVKPVAQGLGIGYAQYVNPDESRTSNTVWGGIGGSGGAFAGKLFDAGIRKGAQKYAQSAIPGLIDKATDKIKGYISPEQATQKLQANFNVAAAKNTANWNKTNALAETLDSTLTSQGKAFDASPFTNHIQDFSDKLKGMEPAVRAKYAQAADFANHIQDQAPQSFSGAVALRQNLNQELKKYLEKNNIKAADKETGNLIKDLKTSLQDTVNTNGGNVDNRLLNQFKDTWESANKSHQDLTEFVKTPNADGALRPRVPRRKALNDQALDAGALGQYLRPSMRGDAGINQLNKLTGNDEAARSYLMRNVMEKSGNPKSALTEYEKLSVPQRERLFDSLPEGQSLKAAGIARAAFPEPSRNMTWELLKHKLGGFAGSVASLGGIPLAAKYASPSSVIKAVNRAKTPNKNSGRYLSPGLASLFASMEGNQ